MLVGALFLLGASTCTIAPAGEIELSSSTIRVHDLIDLSCLPADDRTDLGALVVAELAPGLSRTLRRDAIANLVRRRVPMLGALLGDANEITLISPAAPSPTRICAFAARRLAEGALIAETDIERQPCTGAATLGVLYDARTGLSRTRAVVEPGQNLGPMAPLPQHVLARGALVDITIQSGPVLIQRRVRLTQDAASGARAFVSSDTGERFSVHFSELTP